MAALTFNFWGEDSSSYGITVVGDRVHPMPERRVEFLDIPGRSGTLTWDDNTYKDITIPIECNITGSDIVGTARNIKAWLMQGQGQLIFNDEPDKYYTAQVVNSFDIVASVINFGSFTILFSCKPFAFKLNEAVQTLTAPGVVTNYGTIYALPVISITGSGNITFLVNSQSVTLTGISGTVTIDSGLSDCYAGTTNMNGSMSGAFPSLTPGQNTITWTGTVTKVDVLPNSAWL